MIDSTITALLSGAIIVGTTLFKQQLIEVGKEIWKNNKQKVYKRFLK